MVKHYYAIYTDGYLSRLGVGYDQPEVTETEYNRLNELVANKPEAPDGYEYRITETGEYVLVEVEPVPEAEPTADELLNILLGGEDE